MSAGDLALEVGGSALGDQAALVEYRDPVGGPIGFLTVLGGEEYGSSTAANWPVTPITARTALCLRPPVASDCPVSELSALPFPAPGPGASALRP